MYAKQLWPLLVDALQGRRPATGRCSGCWRTSLQPQRRRHLRPDQRPLLPDRGADQHYKPGIKHYLAAGNQSWGLFDHAWWNTGYGELNYGLFGPNRTACSTARSARRPRRRPRSRSRRRTTRRRRTRALSGPPRRSATCGCDDARRRAHRLRRQLALHRRRRRISTSRRSRFRPWERSVSRMSRSPPPRLQRRSRCGRSWSTTCARSRTPCRAEHLLGAARLERPGGLRSDRLELLERLAAAAAVADRAARGRAEDVLQLRVGRAAVRAAEAVRSGAGRASAPRPRAARRGEKPAARSFSRPSRVIRSVDHESSITTSTSGSAPSSSIRSAICSRMTSSAGQPRNVGVNSTCTRSPSTRTSRMTPRSTSEITGISGSWTSASAAQTCSAVTTSRPGLRAPHLGHLLPELGELRRVAVPEPRVGDGCGEWAQLLERGRESAARPSSRSSHISACIRW